MDKIKILIVDDHQMIIDGIALMLKEMDEAVLVGTTNNGLGALQFVSHNSVDVILMDINMPEMNGMEASKRIKQDYPDIKIIAISMFDEISFINRMIKNGADGYLLKNASLHEINQAIKDVIQGKKYFTEEVMSAIIDHMK